MSIKKAIQINYMTDIYDIVEVLDDMGIAYKDDESGTYHFRKDGTLILEFID